MTSPALDLLKALRSLSMPKNEVTGVGVDLVEIRMFNELLMSGRSTFLNIGWTKNEQLDAEGISERLAARWAAKEAVMKTLGRGLGDIDPLDIEVTRMSSGAPEVQLRGSAAEIAKRTGIENIRVSISHEQGWAVALAVATQY